MSTTDWSTRRRTRRGLAGVRLLEALEPRLLLTTFPVSSTADSGPGTLRQAILSANSNPGADIISFQLTGTGVHTITPASALPTITGAVTIDGATQSGYAGKPLIFINGTSAGSNSSGLDIAAGGCTVRGLAIGNFAIDGIFLDVFGGNTITGDYLGTDASGEIAAGNGEYGLLADTGNNQIVQNVISANGVSPGFPGVQLYGTAANDNVITDNLIGTDAAGMVAMGNGGVGLYISGGASGNRVGTNGDGVNDAAERNVIDANAYQGIAIGDPGTNNNIIAGNLIGLAADGTTALGNQNNGIFIYGGAQNNRVGMNPGDADIAAERNIVSGNVFTGIVISDAGASGNKVVGNYVGTDSSGEISVENQDGGISVSGPDNQVVQNLISGNGISDQAAGLQIYGSVATGNVVTGNLVGTDAAGSAALGNGGVGIFLWGGANGNQIGTNGDGVNDAAEGNVVSANAFQGISIGGIGSDNNVVAGNIIGLNAAGTAILANQDDGLLIYGGAQDNRIGMNPADADPAAEKNIISGNVFAGVTLSDSGTSNNLVAGNYIGTDPSGKLPLGNGDQGVLVFTGASSNTIDRNVIAANGLPAHFPGIELYGTVTSNVITGNLVGLDSSGAVALGNGGVGIYLHNGASDNRIGTDGDGVNDAAEGNVIANSGYGGIELDDSATTANQIAGNKIGTDITGSVPMPNNGPGVWVRLGANDTTIGGPSAVFGNLIAYNGGPYPQMGGYHFDDDPGVIVTDGGTGNTIRANSIFSNRGIGIDLSNSPQGFFDGVTVNNANNVDSGSNHLQNYPVILSATSGAVTQVSGTLNSMPGTIFTLDFYASSAPNPALFGDGQRYLGAKTVTTDSTGNVYFQFGLAAATSAGEYLTATATDPAGNTSEFSADRQLNAAPFAIGSTSWTAIGPEPISVLGDGVLASGRVAEAIPDPTNVNVMYIGTDGGGVWKTSDWLDPQPVWTPLTDSQSSLQLSDGYRTLAIVPSNPQILYAAASGPGGAILKTTNGGATWTPLSTALFDEAYFTSLAISPTDPNTLYVGIKPSGTPGGLYKSTDGGVTWTNTMSAIVGSGGVSDVVMNPSSPLTLYTGVVAAGNANGVYKTTDGGNSWTLLTSGLLTGTGVGSGIRLAISKSAPSTVYVTIFDPALGNAPDGLPHRFVTTNNGTSWTALSALPGDEESRYWHVVLSVDPTNSQIIYVNGDHALYRSADGGTTWTNIFGEDPVDVDFDDTGAVVLTGDRGIHRWPGGNTPFDNKQGNLQDTENYTVTLDPNNPSTLYAVAQDHGAVLKYSGTGVWNYTGGGAEVGRVIVDPANSSRLYAFTPGGPDSGVATSIMVRSDDGGATWANSDSGLPSDIADFTFAYTSQKAFVMDPQNVNRLLVGVTQVYETTNDASTWHSITGNADLSSGHFISALAIAPSNSNIVYAATDDGKLWYTANDGATAWIERDSGLPIQQYNRVLDLKIDPTNPLRIFAVTSGDRTGLIGNHVWMTINGGQSWMSISGNQNPEIWVQSLAVDWRFATPTLYIGTARGVFASTNLGSTWASFATGLPNVVVEDVELLPNSNLLAAATYGRGVFEIRVGTPTTLTLAGGANTVYVKRDSNATLADFWINSVTPGQGTPTQQWIISQASTFTVNGGAGNVTLTVDFSSGNPLPAGGVTFNGGSGNNTLSVISNNQPNNVYAGNASLIFGAQQISFSNVGSMLFNDEGASDSISVTGPIPFTLAIGNGSDTLTIAPAASARVNFGSSSGHLVVVNDGSLVINAGSGNPNLRFAAAPALVDGAGTSSISGILYNDLNGDGKREVGEPGIAGRTVFLDLNRNGKRDPGEPATVTGPDGSYRFANLAAGKYRIRQTIPASGWRVTSGGAIDVTLAAGQAAAGENFGQTDRSRIAGVLFIDKNANGKPDAGERLLSNQVVYIDANNNGKLDKGEKVSVTDGQGRFGFDGLQAGTLHIRVAPAPKQSDKANIALSINILSGTVVTGIRFIELVVFGQLLTSS